MKKCPKEWLPDDEPEPGGKCLAMVVLSKSDAAKLLTPEGKQLRERFGIPADAKIKSENVCLTLEHDKFPERSEFDAVPMLRPK